MRRLVAMTLLSLACLSARGQQGMLEVQLPPFLPCRSVRSCPGCRGHPSSRVPGAWSFPLPQRT